MDRTGLTVKEVAAQLGVAEKTIYRRLRRPGHGGLDAWKVHTPHGEEWRVNLTTSLDTTQDSGQDTEAVSVSPVPHGMSRPSVSPELSQVLAALAESMQERQALALRLGQVEAEREQLRLALQSMQQRPVQRVWWAFWRRGGDEYPRDPGRA